MNNDNLIHIGTSGWHYGHWREVFYPDDIDSSSFLNYYAHYFKSVEINGSFYRLPESKSFTQWRDSVPDNFVFSVKASRYITHMKKLKDPEEPVTRLIDRINSLGKKLGPILFQLPPNWNINLKRLESFLETLPDSYRYAFEFRDPRWFCEETEKALAEKSAALCIYDFNNRTSPFSLTADFTYIRLHGPDDAYKGKYDKKALSEWADFISKTAASKKEVYCYFDNDEKGYAIQNALSLIQLLDEKK
jgi:uncharacterized protein YecE (DUF72 family)